MEPLQIDDTGQIAVPQPEDIERKSKDDAMGAYLMMFASIFIAPIPFINFIASWIYYAIFRKKDRFVAFHAYQSMLSQLLISILNVAMMISIMIPTLSFIVSDFENFEHSMESELDSLADLGQLIFEDSNRVYLSLAFIIFVALWNLFYLVYSLLAAIASYKGRFWYMPFFGSLAFDCFYGCKALKRQQNTDDNYVNKPPKGY